MKTQLEEQVNLVKMAEAIDHAGLTLKDYLALAAMPGNMTEIARACAYTTACCTGHVDRMERDGLCQRDPFSDEPGKRRGRIVRRTERGMKIMQDIRAAALA